MLQCKGRCTGLHETNYKPHVGCIYEQTLNTGTAVMEETLEFFFFVGQILNNSFIHAKWNSANFLSQNNVSPRWWTLAQFLHLMLERTTPMRNMKKVALYPEKKKRSIWTNFPVIVPHKIGAGCGCVWTYKEEWPLFAEEVKKVKLMHSLMQFSEFTPD